MLNKSMEMRTSTEERLLQRHQGMMKDFMQEFAKLKAAVSVAMDRADLLKK